MLPAFIFISARSVAQQSIIYAEVEGEYVTLGEDQAFRNCGALYFMEIEQDQDLITWYQVDTGMAAFCYCNFDLAVTYGPLEPGDYFVEVYYTESYSEDTIYSGSTTFTILGKEDNHRSGIISQYQSECYQVGIQDQPDMEDHFFMVYPNPLQRGEEIHIFMTPFKGEGILEIYSPEGRLVMIKKIKGDMPGDLLEINENDLAKGIYLIRLVSGEFCYCMKFIVN